jgi:hypothetical protein
MRTEPRYSCNGDKLKYPKLTSFTTYGVQTPIHFQKTVNVNCDQGSSSTELMPDWIINDLVWFLVAVILTALTLWAIYEILKSLKKKEPVTAVVAEDIKTSDETEKNNVNASESKTVPDWNSATVFLAQLQKTGGTANYEGLDLDIPPQGGINIINVETRSGNVRIHATNDTTTEGTTIVSFPKETQKETEEKK